MTTKDKDEERAFYDLLLEIVFHLVRRHGKETEDIFCKAVIENGDLDDLRADYRESDGPVLTDHDIDVLNRIQIAYALQENEKEFHPHAKKLVMDALKIEREKFKRRCDDGEKCN